MPANGTNRDGCNRETEAIVPNRADSERSNLGIGTLDRYAEDRAPTIATFESRSLLPPSGGGECIAGKLASFASVSKTIKNSRSSCILGNRPHGKVAVRGSKSRLKQGRRI